MKKQKLKVLNKLFTRPFNFPTIHGYSESLCISLPDIIDFRFSVIVMFSQHGVLEVYRDKGESTKKLVSHIQKKIKDGSFDLDKFIKDYREAIKIMKNLLAKYSNKKVFDKLNSNELISDIKKFSEAWVFGGAGMVIVYWLSFKDDDTIKTLREESEKMYYYGHNFYQVFIDYIAEKEGLEPKLADYLSREEIINYFKDKKLSESAELRKRFNGILLFNNEHIYLSRAELKRFLEEKKLMLETEPVYKGDIKGSMACKGKIKGRVRIVKHHRDCSLVKPGDILIAPMTTPNYVEAMKRAGAIVTDEGGMLSHAAIVARELKKPCVVGTKIATKVFKDGDLVEVDANNGIVRKLK